MSGKIAYEAFFNFKGGKDPVGADLVEWDKLDTNEQLAWTKVAADVKTAVLAEVTESANFTARDAIMATANILEGARNSILQMKDNRL